MLQLYTPWLQGGFYQRIRICQVFFSHKGKKSEPPKWLALCYLQTNIVFPSLLSHLTEKNQDLLQLPLQGGHFVKGFFVFFFEMLEAALDASNDFFAVHVSGVFHTQED